MDGRRLRYCSAIILVLLVAPLVLQVVQGLLFNESALVAEVGAEGYQHGLVIKPTFEKVWSIDDIPLFKSTLGGLPARAVFPDAPASGMEHVLALFPSEVDGDLSPTGHYLLAPDGGYACVAKIGEWRKCFAGPALWKLDTEEIVMHIHGVFITDGLVLDPSTGVVYDKLNRTYKISLPTNFKWLHVSASYLYYFVTAANESSTVMHTFEWLYGGGFDKIDDTSISSYVQYVAGQWDDYFKTFQLASISKTKISGYRDRVYTVDLSMLGDAFRDSGGVAEVGVISIGVAPPNDVIRSIIVAITVNGKLAVFDHTLTCYKPTVGTMRHCRDKIVPVVYIDLKDVVGKEVEPVPMKFVRTVSSRFLALPVREKDTGLVRAVVVWVYDTIGVNCGGNLKNKAFGIHIFVSPARPGRAVAISADGQYLFVGDTLYRVDLPNILPPPALVPLWNVTHRTYMAKFIGDNKVVISWGHGDVSPDGKYVCTVGEAWVYDVKTGKLLAHFVPDTDDSYGDCWNLETGQKVWDRSGFFSGDGKRMVEDVKKLGTSAVVVDTETWSTIPIDWGFTASGDYFYAVQLDYDGDTLAVGYIGSSWSVDTSKLLVYKYDPSKGTYVKVLEHSEYGDYGRRLQMTLDGKIIIVSGVLYPYVDIWKWNGTTYVRVARIPVGDPNGVGALGISDPWNVGYVLIGTVDGDIIVAKYDRETDEIEIVGGVALPHPFEHEPWFYNPFYERWIPKVTEVFAFSSHRDSDRLGYRVIFDTLTHSVIVVDVDKPGTPYQYAAAVSPTGSYVFLGNTLYMVLKRDPESGTPRLRFVGETYIPRSAAHLATPIHILVQPKGYSLYFVSGKVTVSRLISLEVPVSLIRDEVILHGKLGKMLERGLISYRVLIQEAGYVDRAELFKVGRGSYSPDKTIAYAVLHRIEAPYAWNGHGFEGATVASAVTIYVPLNQPMSLYSEMRLNTSIVIVAASPVFDFNKELLGVLGLWIGTPDFSVVEADELSKLAAEVAARKAEEWGVGTVTAEDIAKALARANTWYERLARAAALLLSRVGLAAIFDSGVGMVSKYVTYQNVRVLVMVMPVAEYGPYKLGAVKFLLPLEEVQNYAQEYYDHAKEVAKSLGLTDVAVQFFPIGQTWDDYRRQLEEGRFPSVDLRALLQETASLYGVPVDALKITGVYIVIEVLTHGMSSLWQWATGGLKVPVVVVAYGNYIQVKAKSRGGIEITDPYTIARMVGDVVINGVSYSLEPCSEGACAYFSLMPGFSGVAIEFPHAPASFLADVNVTLQGFIEVPMKPIPETPPYYGYEARLSYDLDWMWRLKSIEILDVPYPMYKVEREYIYRYASWRHDITEAFELSAVVQDPSSPTGKRYSYVTRVNTEYIDPANGGILEKGETIVIRYFYRQPPDASIAVYLNGTRVTSTLAHHATVVVESWLRDQYVEYEVVAQIKAFKGVEEVVVYETAWSDVLEVKANSSAYKTYDISELVETAIKYMQATNRTCFLEIVARIVRAGYDYVESNNEYRVVYYPPPLLPQMVRSGNFSVVVEVVDATTLEPVPNATVRAYYGYNESRATIAYEAKTDEQGRTLFVLMGGTWTFVAEKEGYISGRLTTEIFNDTVVRLYLVPESAENYVEPGAIINNTRTPVIVSGKPYYWLGVQVVYANGLPMHGALVEVYNATSGELIASMETNGTGFVWALLPANQNYTIHVYARNAVTGQELNVTRTIVLDRHLVLVFKAPWLPPEEELRKKYVLYVRVYDATNGQGIANATVIVSRGRLGYVSKTNATGVASVTLPFLGRWYVIALHPSYVAVNRSIVLVENESFINIPLMPASAEITVLPPVNGSYPPIIINGTPQYWVSVQVLYADGFPFHGAVVRLYNATSGQLIAELETNGTGFVHFLVPANASVKLAVNATNPANASQTYYEEKAFNVDSRHWYIVVQLPWRSQYFSPEVMIMRAELVVSRGQGYFFGAVKHLVIVHVWTNVRQTITLRAELWKSDQMVAYVERSFVVDEGVNAVMLWVPVNASEGGWYRAHVVIASYEQDTRLDNNEAWTRAVFLKPFVDFRVSIWWRPLAQKLSWALLPGDLIEIDVRIELPINTTDVPLKVRVRVEYPDYENKTVRVPTKTEKTLKLPEGVAWLNFTVRVPWSDRIVVNASLVHDWDDVPGNNNASLIIEVDPEVELKVVKAPIVMREGTKGKIVVEIRSNRPEGAGTGRISVVDHTTKKLVAAQDIVLGPRKTIEIEFEAPENPSMFWIVRKPAEVHEIEVSYAGMDTLGENNAAKISVTVLSTQALIAAIITAIVVAGLFFMMVAAARIAKGSTVQPTFVKRARSEKRFVRRRSSR